MPETAMFLTFAFWFSFLGVSTADVAACAMLVVRSVRMFCTLSRGCVLDPGCLAPSLPSLKGNRGKKGIDSCSESLLVLKYTN